MFTGIIEATGIVKKIEGNGTNRIFTLSCPFVSELKTDQSLAHNGACLTVEKVGKDFYTVTAIEESLKKTNLGLLKERDEVNLERSLLMSSRLDGHFVTGHVDQTAICEEITDRDGSSIYTFSYIPQANQITVEKGSICVNGVSLTVFNSQEGKFSVAIIPYTFAHTNFNRFVVGTVVNLEFDMLGKYVMTAALNAQLPRDF